MATLKDSTYNTPTTLTITLASLAQNTGRQCTEVDNTTNKYQRVEVSASIKLGTSPVANTAVYLYIIRNNNAGTPIRDDGAGAADAAWTQKSAQILGVLSTGILPATGDVLSGNFLLYDPGAKWAIGVMNLSGVALDATPGNHVMSYNGITTDIT